LTEPAAPAASSARASASAVVDDLTGRGSLSVNWLTAAFVLSAAQLCRCAARVLGERNFALVAPATRQDLDDH
jgi:hypothetical protein